MQALIQNLVNGLAQGSVYALVALGYTMVYGVLQFINFAHAEIFMLGAFGGIFVAGWLTNGEGSFLSLVLVTFGAMAFCTGVGLAVERIAYRPLRHAPRLNVLITAIGVSLLLQNLGILVFGADPRVFPAVIPTHALFDSQNLVITNIQVLVIGTSAALMLGLHWLVRHTKLGMAMRAVSFDIETASLMGIPIDRIIAFTFAIGSALAGCAAVLYGLTYPKVDPLMGVIIGLKAFVAAVFGGIGSFVGAALGGLLMGLAETLVVYYVSSSFRDALAFGLLIVILLVKPTGLFGSMAKEKV
ncbi:MAG: branched-chain amino acid ABC transporter permease [Bdellovibrionales bacterium]|nr:branched-chain amino acid ABC transporter permease [Bdellovibrionales bacterium]